jgi:hypothetical protein
MSMHPCLLFDPHAFVELEEIVIPRDATTETLVRAGKYESNPTFFTSKKFPITSRGPFCPTLALLIHEAPTPAIQQGLDHIPYRLASVTEFLALEARHRCPQFQPMTCLNGKTTLRRRRRVPMVISDAEGWRYLVLGPYYQRWPVGTQVVLVKNTEVHHDALCI